MKEAIGGTWLFQIAIVFILMFTGYMCLSINHSKAFGIKSEIVESISRHGGVEPNEIKDILRKASYRTRGSCKKLKTTDGGEWTGYDRNGKRLGNDQNNATFCVRRVNVNSTNTGVNELPDMYYYQVRVFYQLDLPIFNSLFSFTVRGDTNILYFTGEGVDRV